MRGGSAEPVPEGAHIEGSGDLTCAFADDRTSTAKWVDLGIEPRTFEGLPVDAFEVIDHGPEVPLTDECTRH